MRSVLLLLLSALMMTCSGKRTQTSASPDSVPQPVGQSGHWQLLFQDEFDGEALDTSKWATCYWWGIEGCTISSNDELEWYQPENVLVEDGLLKLQARKQEVTSPDDVSYPYTSGMVTTGRENSDRSQPPKFEFQYGYTEIRAKVPKGQGLWPAFWLLPTTHRSKPEIDVLEILGHQPDKLYMYFHYLNTNGEAERTGDSWIGPDFSSEWHVFAIDWRPEALVWYIDGVEKQRLDDAAIIPATSMYLLLNLAVGGAWPGSPDETTSFPSNYMIDYVRVWGRGPQSSLTPIGSSYIDAAEPAQKFTSSPYLIVDGDPAKIVYLTFDTTALAGQRIESATLRIWIADEPGSGSAGLQEVRLVEHENTISNHKNGTYMDRPSLLPTVIGVLKATVEDEIYDIPLDVTGLRPKIGTTFSLAITSKEDDGLHFYASRHRTESIRLLITTTNGKK
jgi:beta-glucanase (GH16 family)